MGRFSADYKKMHCKLSLCVNNWRNTHRYHNNVIEASLNRQNREQWTWLQKLPFVAQCNLDCSIIPTYGGKTSELHTRETDYVTSSRWCALQRHTHAHTPITPNEPQKRRKKLRKINHNKNMNTVFEVRKTQWALRLCLSP